MPNLRLEKLERYPIGYVYVEIDQIVAVSHAGQKQRVVVLRNGEKVMISACVSNMVTILGRVPDGENADG